MTSLRTSVSFQCSRMRVYGCTFHREDFSMPDSIKTCRKKLSTSGLSLLLLLTVKFYYRIDLCIYLSMRFGLIQPTVFKGCFSFRKFREQQKIVSQISARLVTQSALITSQAKPPRHETELRRAANEISVYISWSRAFICPTVRLFLETSVRMSKNIAANLTDRKSSHKSLLGF